MAKKKKKKTKRSKRKKKMAANKPAMIITASRRKLIVQLAELLADMAPATSRGKTSFCVQNIAIAKKHKMFWKAKSNKKKSIAFYLENVFRQFERTPKKVVIEIVEGGVKWSAKKGKAVSDEQIDAIINTLAKLGVSAKKELKAINRPTPSQIVKPTLDLQGKIDQLELHSALSDDCIQLFKDGHLNDAVRKALERFEKKIQDHLGESDIGKSLMGKAFNHQARKIPINDGTNGNDQSEQEGFMHLTMGAMAGMRNIYSHGDVDTITPMDAFERLCFVSLLFKRVDAALSMSAISTS